MSRPSVVPRRRLRLVVHPGAVRGVRGARAQHARGQAVHARRHAHAREVPQANLLRGAVGLQQAPVSAPRLVRVNAHRHRTNN